MTQAHLEDIVGSVTDHCNKANITIKQVTQVFFLFSSAYKSHVYEKKLCYEKSYVYSIL